MNRETIYFTRDGEPGTFDNDNLAPSLPLPKLNDTLSKYYESLIPFGTVEELRRSKKIIESFQNGIGEKLQEILEEKAKKQKNWVEDWWENYAYLSDRTPIFPYSSMAQPLLVESVGIDSNAENCLKVLARLSYHILEFWHLIRMERLKPGSNPDKSVTFSSFLYRRFYNCARIPGELMDKIVMYFKTISEGEIPSHFLIIGRGRIFQVNALNEDGSILSIQQLYSIYLHLTKLIDEKSIENPVPVLTSDSRTSWAQNRNYIIKLSQKNSKMMDAIEKAIVVISMDDCYPDTWSEISEKVIGGDLHSRWADKSSTLVVFKNGKFGCIGEHSCYDGTISISFSFFILLSLLQYPEPDWNDEIKPISNTIELVFDLDSHIKNEIKRVLAEVDITKHDVTLSTTPFTGYGKNYLKSNRLHPDGYVQMVLQLVYYRMHNEFVATYETALMRNYYNGRTETVRSCTVDAINWVKSFIDTSETDKKRMDLLKIAIQSHLKLMREAQQGKGIDRHLFGLWCVAFDQELPIPELYDDPMYKKSGGGGNFILSTSTLGFTINNGFVGPMSHDGYGIFYSITSDMVWLNTTSFRKSYKTSGHKFTSMFIQSMNEVRDLIERTQSAKL